MMNARGSDDEAEDKDKEVDKTDTTVMAMRSANNPVMSCDRNLKRLLVQQSDLD